MVTFGFALFLAASVTEPTFPSEITVNAAAATMATEALAAFPVTSAVAVTDSTGFALASTDAAPAPVVNFAGQVLERGTRRPVPDATVIIADLGLTAITDAEGKFAFEDVPAGRFDIVVPVMGFQRYATFEQLAETERTDVVYYLEPDFGSPLEVIVEADKVRKEVTKTILRREEIRKIPGTGGDAIKAITALPGVATSNELGSDIIVRGSGPFDNRIEIDRIGVPYIFHFGGFKSVINSDQIETLDFQAGGFSANFGRATGGVLLTNTRPGRGDRFGGAADVNVAMAEGYIEGPIGDKGSYFIGGRRSYFDIIVGPAVKAAVPDDQLEFTVFPQFYDYQFRADYTPVTGTTVSGFVFGADDIMSLLLKRSDPREPNLVGDFMIHPFFNMGGVRLTNKWRNFENRAQVYYSEIGQEIEIGTGNHLNIVDRTPGFIDDASYRFGSRNILNFGTQLSYDSIAINTRFPQPPRQGQTDFTFSDAPLITSKRVIEGYAIGAYVDDMIYVTPKWMLDPGVRVDTYHQDETYTYVDPRLLSRWEVTDKFTLKGAVGRYSDFPDEQQLDRDFGEPSLEPIHSTHYVLGTEYKLTPSRLIDVQAYYKWIDNLVESFPTGKPYRNTGVGEAYGVEIFLRQYLTDRFFGWASYAYSVSRRKFQRIDGWYAAGFDQPHIVNLVASYKLSNRWELGGKWRYSSGNPNTPYVDRVYVADTSQYIPIPGETNSERLPAQHRLDARLEYSYPHTTWTWRFYLEVWNVYGAKNAADYSNNYDYTRREPVTILPVPVPLLGTRLEF